MTDFSWIIDKLYYIPGVFIGLSFHEFSHALAAHAMGDDTAKRAGRLTIDPRAHMDIIGFLTLLIAGFGWAKPVPIDPWSFKNRRFGTILVSLAGPLMNFVLALLTLVLLYSLNIAGYDNEIITNIIYYIFIVNVVLCVFNLIPIPPLDGSKILASVLPNSLESKIYQLERYSYMILLILVFSNALDYILRPMINFLIDKLDFIVYHIFLIFGII